LFVMIGFSLGLQPLDCGSAHIVTARSGTRKLRYGRRI
jgi:hypothetical protein